MNNSNDNKSLKFCINKTMIIYLTLNTLRDNLGVEEVFDSPDIQHILSDCNSDSGSSLKTITWLTYYVISRGRKDIFK